MLAFSLVSMLFLYALQRLQFFCRNPQMLAGVPPGLAFTLLRAPTNTTGSVLGRADAGYLTQMVGLTSHNFFRHAAGSRWRRRWIPRIRARTQRRSGISGSSHATTLWVLRALFDPSALVLVWQGVPDNFSPYVNATTLEGAPQTIAEGAGRIAGNFRSSGPRGGFMNVQLGASVRESDAVDQPLEMLPIFSIGAGLTHTLARWSAIANKGGRCSRSWRSFFWGRAPAIWLSTRQSAIHQNGNRSARDRDAKRRQHGGKETRFGIVESAMWATVTTDTSCGAVNRARRLHAAGRAGADGQYATRRVIFGGVGSGLYGIIVDGGARGVHRGSDGRPHAEYLGKKSKRAK